MSVDVREQLRRAAGDADRGPDITTAMQRGDSLRSQRRTAGVAAGTTIIAAVVVIGSWLPGAVAPPQIVTPPAGTPDEGHVGEPDEQGWSELSRGTRSDGSVWILAGQRTNDTVCVRWQVPATDTEHTNCGANPSGSDMLVMGSADPELIMGYVGPDIATVEIVLDDGTTLQAHLHAIPDSDLHAYVAEIGDQTVTYVVGRDADGETQVQLSVEASPPHEAERQWVVADSGNPADEGAGDVWVIGYFLVPDHTSQGVVHFADLEPRWKRLPEGSPPGSQVELLRLALMELGTPGPEGLLHPLEGSDLRLTSASRDGAALVLDFEPGDWTGANLGSSGEAAMFNQIAAVAVHYFPGADELCVLVDGRETFLFSGGLSSCPHRLP